VGNFGILANPTFARERAAADPDQISAAQLKRPSSHVYLWPKVDMEGLLSTSYRQSQEQ
jgi:hypothetical protein